MVKRRYGKSKGGYRKKKAIRKRRVYRRKMGNKKSTGHYIECNATKAMTRGTFTVEAGLQNRMRVYWGLITAVGASEISLDSSLEF